MKKKRLTQILAIILGLAGAGVLAWIFLPIMLYEFTSSPLASYISPIPEKGIQLASGGDLTKASNWFPGGKTSADFGANKISFYNISIPKLKINRSIVSIGGEDLSESLIQYPGTALPGKSGNSVIFGHSILPQFYDPKDYLSIFSTLPTLKKGDEILVDFDGISYKFVVETKFEVLPTDLQILEQNLSDSFLTLVTCVPPGDPRRPRRLVVRARLVPVGTNTQNKI